MKTSKMASLDFSPMDEAAAREIVKWRYPPPYEIYNPTPLQERNWIHVFLRRNSDYHTITDTQLSELTAYCCFGYEARVPGGDYLADAMDLGFTMRPDMTGKGLGGFGRSQQSLLPIPDHFGNAADRCGNNGKAAGHGFQQDVGVAFGQTG